jgi:hypothetical protein
MLEAMKYVLEELCDEIIVKVILFCLMTIPKDPLNFPRNNKLRLKI